MYLSSDEVLEATLHQPAAQQKQQQRGRGGGRGGAAGRGGGRAGGGTELSSKSAEGGAHDAVEAMDEGGGAGEAEVAEGEVQADDADNATAAGSAEASGEAAEGTAKRQKTASASETGTRVEATGAIPPLPATTLAPPGSDGMGGGGVPYRTMVTSRPVVEARGHTGYLTFARKFV